LIGLQEMKSWFWNWKTGRPEDGKGDGLYREKIDARIVKGIMDQL
jgi:hypothetical protein